MTDNSIGKPLFKAIRYRLPWIWLLGLVSLVCSFAMPLVIGRLTNLFAEQSNLTIQKVSAEVGFGMGAMAVVALCNYFSTLVSGYTQEEANRYLSVRIFKSLLYAPASFFRDQEPERLNVRVLDDAWDVAGFYVSLSSNVPLAVISLLAYGAWMLANNLLLGAVTLPLSFLSVYFLFFDKKIQSLNAQGHDATENLKVTSIQIITGIDEIRLNAAFTHGVSEVDRALQRFRGIHRRVTRIQSLFSAISPLVGAIQNGILQWVGAALCLGYFMPDAAGKMTWGQVMSFMTLSALFQNPLHSITGFLLQWRMNREGIRRVQDLLDLPAEFASQPELLEAPVPPPALHLDDIEVKLPSGARLLSGLSIDIPSGKHVALVGPAGCGKSTTLGAIIRQTTTSKGSVLLGEHAVERYDFQSIAAKVGFVAQKPILFDTSIRNNILLSLRRPSPNAIRDEIGDIDLGNLPGIGTRTDLDKHILEIIRLVGLHEDVLRKALDNPQPDVLHSFDQKILLDFRCSLAAKLASEGLSLIPFRIDTTFPGTLVENLLGPGSSTDTASVKVVLQLLGREHPLVGKLASLGHARFVSDSALRVWLSRQSPNLARLLDGTRGKGDNLAHPTGDLSKLSPDEFAHFVESGLGCELERIGPEGREEMGVLLVAARASIREQGGDDKRWAKIEHHELPNHLPLRDSLLFARAHEESDKSGRIDALLLAELEAKGLADTLLLAGLEFRVGEGGRFLSGGQRQKVAIARTVLKNPNLLLLDEATASLDEISQRRVTDMISQRFANRTVVSISHRLSTIRDCDRIFVLDRGALAQEGDYATLAGRDGLFRSLLGQEGGGEPLSPAGDMGERPLDIPQPEDAIRELVRELSLCPLFSDLELPYLTMLARTADMIRHAKDSVLFRQGDTGRDIFLILKGKVNFLVEKPDRSHEFVTQLGQGGLFGEMSLFSESGRSLTAMVVENAVLCRIPADRFVELLEADSSVAIKLLRNLSRRLLEKEAKLYKLNSNES